MNLNFNEFGGTSSLPNKVYGFYILKKILGFFFYFFGFFGVFFFLGVYEDFFE